MRIEPYPRFPGSDTQIIRKLTDLHREIAQQLNLLSEGVASAVHNKTTAAPTAGTYAQGDFIKNSAPTESGGAGSMYVILGWICVASGSPGTWRECRVLTGN